MRASNRCYCWHRSVDLMSIKCYRTYLRICLLTTIRSARPVHLENKSLSLTFVELPLRKAALEARDSRSSNHLPLSKGVAQAWPFNRTNILVVAGSSSVILPTLSLTRASTRETLTILFSEVTLETSRSSASAVKNSHSSPPVKRAPRRSLATRAND